MKNLILFGIPATNENINNLMKISRNLKDCSITFMEDATIGTVTKSEIKDIGHNLFCLEEDFEARGLEHAQIPENIKFVNYLDLIDLISSSTRIISML